MMTAMTSFCFILPVCPAPTLSLSRLTSRDARLPSRGVLGQRDGFVARRKRTRPVALVQSLQSAATMRVYVRLLGG